MKKPIEKITIFNKHRDDYGITYFINYNDRTVTAVTTFRLDPGLFVDNFTLYCKKYLYNGFYCTQGPKHIFTLDKIPSNKIEKVELSATAFCHKDDKFDKNVGMAIAFLKLTRKQHNLYMINVNNAFEQFKKHLTALSGYKERIQGQLARVTNRTARICKESKVWQ